MEKGEEMRVGGGNEEKGKKKMEDGGTGIKIRH